MDETAFIAFLVNLDKVAEGIKTDLDTITDGLDEIHEIIEAKAEGLPSMAAEMVGEIADSVARLSSWCEDLIDRGYARLFPLLNGEEIAEEDFFDLFFDGERNPDVPGWSEIARDLLELIFEGLRSGREGADLEEWALGGGEHGLWSVLLILPAFALAEEWAGMKRGESCSTAIRAIAELYARLLSRDDRFGEEDLVEIWEDTMESLIDRVTQSDATSVSPGEIVSISFYDIFEWIHHYTCGEDSLLAAFDEALMAAYACARGTWERSFSDLICGWRGIICGSFPMYLTMSLGWYWAEGTRFLSEPLSEAEVEDAVDYKESYNSLVSLANSFCPRPGVEVFTAPSVETMERVDLSLTSMDIVMERLWVFLAGEWQPWVDGTSWLPEPDSEFLRSVLRSMGQEIVMEGWILR